METDDLKVYTPTEINDTPFPTEGEATLATTQTTTGETYSPKSVKDVAFPDPRIAMDLVGNSINTRSKKILAAFEFTPSGALQIGKYELGISGDIRISPIGIVARNQLGVNTLSIDTETGDVFLVGTLQAGTVIGGKVIVGNNTWVIDGDPDFPRLLLYENDIPCILLGEGN